MTFDKRRALKMIAQQNKEIIRKFECEHPNCRDVIEDAAKTCIENFWYKEGGVRTVCRVKSENEIDTTDIERYIQALDFKLTNKVEYEYDNSDDEEYPWKIIIRFNID